MKPGYIERVKENLCKGIFSTWKQHSFIVHLSAGQHTCGSSRLHLAVFGFDVALGEGYPKYIIILVMADVPNGKQNHGKLLNSKVQKNSCLIKVIHVAQTKTEAWRNTRWGEIYDLRWVHGMSVDKGRGKEPEPTVQTTVLVNLQNWQRYIYQTLERVEKTARRISIWNSLREFHLDNVVPTNWLASFKFYNVFF